ncbi:CPBP family intramembrane metalloprotease [Halobacterium sp. CBA1126]|nr:CPBP family intramembrane metalloprotease [Halobacterium sp. CBA1126]
MRTLAARLLYGSDDGRLRATWRVVLPVLTGLTLYLAGQIAVPLGVRAVLGDVSGQRALLWALVLFVLLAFVIAASGFVAVLVAARLDQRPPASYGLDLSRRWGGEFLVGVLIGVIASVGAVLYYAATSEASLQVELTGVGVDSIGLTVLAVAALLLFYLANNVFEELLFRAIFIRTAAGGLQARSLSPPAAVALAVVVSAPVFGLLHLVGSGGVAAVLTSAIAGLLFATAYVLCGQLSLPLGVHFGGVAILTVMQDPVSQSPRLTLPSVFVVDGLGSASLAQSVELWGVRAAIGIALLVAWTYYATGDIEFADELTHAP